MFNSAQGTTITLLDIVVIWSYKTFYQLMGEDHLAVERWCLSRSGWLCSPSQRTDTISDTSPLECTLFSLLNALPHGTYALFGQAKLKCNYSRCSVLLCTPYPVTVIEIPTPPPPANGSIGVADASVVSAELFAPFCSLNS